MMYHKIQQLLLDTVAQLPELKILRVYIRDEQAWAVGIADFKPTQGLRYVEELIIHLTRYVLERDGDQPMRYREIC
jgi:hypothetical protein